MCLEQSVATGSRDRAPEPSPIAHRIEKLLLVAIVLLGLVVSAIGPRDRLTWWLEVAPVLIGLPILWVTATRFPLTRLAYWLLTLHALILMLGGHYTYAEVPLGEWVEQAFGLARNHYDRLGHLAQGFVPAIIVRELLLRRRVVVDKPRGWLLFLVTSVCLALSACYEFVEWWGALLGGEKAEAFLGTQGDVWDTQWDMFLALCGALSSQLTLAALHDRQLRKIER